MLYVRGKICPEEFDVGSRFWVPFGGCSTSKAWWAAGVVVETSRPCAIGVRYRTFGEVRADFANRRAIDGGYSAEQNCV